MIDARHYRVDEALRSGLPVTIRSIRPDDKDALRDAFRGLEARTIYLRFFSHKKDLTDEELRQATEIDFRREVGLVACLREGNRERIIGAGRYFAQDPENHGSRAEVAFVVEEDFHGLGIAGRLLHHLATVARTQGIATFHAVVLPENRAMLRVFERGGFPLSVEAGDGEVHVTLVLTGR
jgi:RimJ/RimL family protein N-acetyltransferase